MIRKIKTKLVRSEELGLVHATRKDVRVLAMVINEVIEKVNELVVAHNKLNSEPKAQECDARDSE